MKELEQLQKENDELRAKLDEVLSVNNIKAMLENEINHLRIDNSDDWHDIREYEYLDEDDYQSISEGMLQYLSRSTPIQSLAEVKAEAVRDYEASLSSFPWTAEEYIANQLK